jgi:uroporphyrinogen-III synthase
MRLLVTRPEPDATTLKAQLIAFGHEVLVEPLLNVVLRPLEPGEIDLDEAQALVATSRNGVRALASSPWGEAAKDLPLFAVGPGTASSARALGFADVRQGPRDARALIPFVAERAQVNGGSLIYLAGETRTGDVGGELRRLGFHVQEPVMYSVAPSDRLSPPILSRLAAGEIDGVLLLSAHTARVWARLILRHGFTKQAQRMTHYCLSRAVAQGLDALGDPPILVASQPDLKALIALVARGVSDLQ